MFSRLPPALLWFGGSALALAALVGVLIWPSSPANQNNANEALIVHCAASQRGPVAAIATAYEAEFGQPVRVNYGPSDTLLGTITTTGKGDVYLPADESYIDDARKRDLTAEIEPVARMSAVLAVRAGNPKQIKAWNDLLRSDVRLVQAYPAAAIGRLTERHLAKSKRWDALRVRKNADLGTVTEVANAVAVGSADAGIVWDVVARPMPELQMVELPELASIEAKVQASVLKCSKQPEAALHFVRYLTSSNKGLPHFRDHGFTRVESGDPLVLNPQLTVYAGAMLRPAIEQTLRDFEKRERVKITTVYDGCGILVSAMETKARPDVFFSCDARFMDQVRDRFDEPKTISSNQLVIAVKKGNPHGVTVLKDLAKPGLKVGVGHEQQCALGAITKDTFIQAGVYGRIAKNVVVQSPTGDLLVNQLLVGSLDVAIVYRSNVLEHAKDLDWTPVTGIACAEPTQPIAVGKETAFPNLSRRLVRAIESAESRRRFEASGFGWGPKK